MHETPSDVGQASTNRRMRLLSCDFGQRFRERRFHSDPRIESEGVVDQGRGDFLHTKSHDVDVCAEMDERDFRLLAVGDVGEGVERYGIPDDLGFRRRVIVRKQEAACGVSAVDFKSLVGGVRRRKAEVMEQRRDVEKLAIVLHLSFSAEELGKPPRPMHMIEQHLGMGLLCQRSGFASEI
nr:hypothetical protein [Bradyrhizobium rifense]